MRSDAPSMEKLEQIRQTLGDIDARVPDKLRAALWLGYRVSSPGEGDKVADFAAFVASLLEPPPPATEDGEHDAAAALRIDWASCYVPLHDHDEHFGNATAGVLGVADGVGSYTKYGVAAGAFSRGLMTNASAEVAGLERPGVRVCPCALLERAYDETAASGAMS